MVYIFKETNALLMAYKKLHKLSRISDIMIIIVCDFVFLQASQISAESRHFTLKNNGVLHANDNRFLFGACLEKEVKKFLWVKLTGEVII